MITAKLAKKPYLEISKSLHDQLAKTGKKTIKIAIHPTNGRKERTTKRETARRKNLSKFIDKTLGIWADDPKIEQAFKELDERWQQWREETLS
jgi:hypothetical protein